MVSKNEMELVNGRTDRPGILGGVGQPSTIGGIRALKAVARDEGRSPITIWRRVKAGLLKSVNIAGRPYITNESLAEFYRRAAAGEFAKPPPGAAGRSAEARAKREMAGKTKDSNQRAPGDFLE